MEATALLISILALLLCFFSFFYFKSYLKRRTAKEWILAETREDVDAILRTLDEATERDITLIEERGKVLRSLLEEIDKRLKIYIREVELQGKAEEALAALSKNQAEAPAPGPREGTYQELGKNRHRRSRQERAAEPQLAFPPADPAPAAEVSPRPSTGEQVREMVRAGFTPSAIASRLGLSISEVEFAATLVGLGSRETEE